MRRYLTLIVALIAAALLAGSLAAAPVSTKVGKRPTATSWASSQIAVVVASGLMAPSVAEFRPDDPLTAGELVDLLTQLGEAPAAPADPSLPVTLADLDAALVRHAGLTPAAKRFRTALAAAGLQPGKRTGSEIVARLLGLRLNHPDESLELLPADAVTRAEAAYSVAQLLAPSGWYDTATISAKAAAFAVPTLTDWQRRILTRAVSFVGYPYVWAGSSENPQSPVGKPAPGGFDCSGFVWRVYKLEPYPDAPQLASVLRGRTTYVMSAEVPQAGRIDAQSLEPGDVIFFGDKGPKSKPAQVGHMGIYLGNGWFVHSSSRGVTIWPLEGYYSDRFAWARRPLAEAGLAEMPSPVEAASPVDPAAPAPVGDDSAPVQ
jgi:cell wall-associated NlpC family hydrolase